MSRVKLRRDLPHKVCAHCGLLFTWRKKWARDWEAVRYCSERCRRTAKTVRQRPARLP